MLSSIFIRPLVVLIMLLNLLVVSNASSLIMFSSPGCLYCQRWHNDIGGIYYKTNEGKIAPLDEVDISEQNRFTGLRNRIIYTPTFVLMDDNMNEVGRLAGYGGDEFFWYHIDNLIVKMTKIKEATIASQSSGVYNVE